ncbi:MAG: SDR family oxidoreductase [Clostridia bacterium]|nr:SDR family oxidoreductase [Clostridia bacterium]MBQ8872587.1 SDR family oxidoreductase [Clostridia bacterium]MBQ9706553.1 SDR family oxidoreductase [Clostridia bacterium]MBR7176683.1 SDR family oxidoreductase [Clostridia bacterium]
MNLPFVVEDLKDKVVVITGAGGVLCGGLAEPIAKCGAKVALLDLNLAAAQKVADGLTAQGLVAKAFECNVLDKQSITNARNAVTEAFGTVDVLINGAGGNNPRATTANEYATLEGNEGDFFSLDQKGVEFVFGLNFTGTFLPTQVFAKDMIGKKDCCILNISSMNAYTPLTKIPAYSGAKAAISNFTQWLAVHFANVGIRVNAIAPGFFVSAQNQALLFNPDGSPTARTEKILKATPMGRFGKFDELTGATLMLISSKAAGFITGVVLPIDGGFSSYSGV